MQVFVDCVALIKSAMIARHVSRNWEEVGSIVVFSIFYFFPPNNFSRFTLLASVTYRTYMTIIIVICALSRGRAKARDFSSWSTAGALINRAACSRESVWGNPCPTLTCSCWMRVEVRLGGMRIARRAIQTVRTFLRPNVRSTNVEMLISRREIDPNYRAHRGALIYPLMHIVRDRMARRVSRVEDVLVIRTSYSLLLLRVHSTLNAFQYCQTTILQSRLFLSSIRKSYLR